LGKEDLHQYVLYKVQRGPLVALSSDIYVDNPMSFADGMRSAFSHQLIKKWGIKIEVRARRHNSKKDWEKPGRLVKKFV